MNCASNPVSYFEIPVHDLARAMGFYRAVLGCGFEQAHVDGSEMAFFPHDEEGCGASGALAQGESYVPGRAGARIYFRVPDIHAALSRAVAAGGVVLYPVTEVGRFGFVAEVEDSEGNCMALHAVAPARA